MTTAQKPDALPVVAWKCGNEFAPYHPQASHINPDHRDGWNACYRAAQASLLAKEAEIERLKQCVKWYADGNHFSLDDWEAPDEPGWLSPPNDESWMVEDGSVARTVLNGGHMVTDDDIIAEPLMSTQAYEGALGRVRELAALDPQPDTQQGRALSVLAAAVERYEKRRFPGMAIDAARAAADQGGSMKTLHADLEALMPEPVALLAQFCGTWRESESAYAEPFFTADQVREAMQAATERAAKLAATLAYDAAIKYANGRVVDFEKEVAAAIRGTA